MADSQRKTANLFDYVSYFDSTFIPYNEFFNYLNLQLQPNTTYTLTTSYGEYTPGSTRVTAFIITASNETPTTANGGISDISPITITTKSDGILCLYKRISGAFTPDYMPTKTQFDNGEWLMLNTGSSPLPYEPYGWLHSLRKLGNYADTVSGISIPTIAGANSFDVLTTLKPSEVSLTYTGWHDASVKEWDGSEWQ